MPDCLNPGMPRGSAVRGPFGAGAGIMSLFEDWLRPYFASGALEPVLEDWWESFSGPFLYYPGRRLVPAPLRAFIDFIRDPANRD